MSMPPETDTRSVRVLEHTRDRLLLSQRSLIFSVTAAIGSLLLFFGLWNKWAEFDETVCWAIGLTGAAFAFFAVYFSRRSWLLFDRPRNVFRWSVPGLMSRTEGVLPLSQVRQVRLDTLYDSEGDTYRSLIEAGSEKVGFPGHYSSDRPGTLATVDLISSWLK